MAYVKLQTTKTYLLPLHTKPNKIKPKLYLVFIITLTTSIVKTANRRHTTFCMKTKNKFFLEKPDINLKGNILSFTT